MLAVAHHAQQGVFDAGVCVGIVPEDSIYSLLAERGERIVGRATPIRSATWRFGSSAAGPLGSSARDEAPCVGSCPQGQSRRPPRGIQVAMTGSPGRSRSWRLVMSRWKVP